MNVNAKTKTRGSLGKSRENITELALSGVFTALVCLLTMYVQVQIIPAKGGLVHIGNVPLFFAAAFFGKKVGALCGGLGMALSDLLTPWAIYAPISLFVVGAMGFVFGVIVNKKPTLLRLILAAVAALAIKLAGYYIGELVLYRSVAVPLASVPGNIIQIVTGAMIAIPAILVTRSAMAWRRNGGEHV